MLIRNLSLFLLMDSLYFVPSWTVNMLYNLSCMLYALGCQENRKFVHKDQDHITINGINDDAINEISMRWKRVKKWEKLIERICVNEYWEQSLGNWRYDRSPSCIRWAHRLYLQSVESAAHEEWNKCACSWERIAKKLVGYHEALLEEWI